ncbi:hypothetical protein KI387_000758, partial [Taxus chinensis]
MLLNSSSRGSVQVDSWSQLQDPMILMTQSNLNTAYLKLVIGNACSMLTALEGKLKALVSIHGPEAGKGGELTHDDTTIISGALDLTEKTTQEAMTPIESTFSLDVNSKLDCLSLAGRQWGRSWPEAIAGFP